METYKYTAENCFESIIPQSAYIENTKSENNTLYLTFEALEIGKEHPLNPFDTECETKEVVLVFYDFEVLESGYYDCSHVQKQVRDFDKDCNYHPIPLLELLNDFSVVTEDIKEKNNTFMNRHLRRVFHLSMEKILGAISGYVINVWKCCGILS
jgi:hypothetical protein